MAGRNHKGQKTLRRYNNSQSASQWKMSAVKPRHVTLTQESHGKVQMHTSMAQVRFDG
jgi:hypothetical protein